MAKMKTANQQNSGPVKPEQYIRTRARLLPVYRCFMTDPGEYGMTNIFVIRRHPKGTFTMGVYLVDLWCLGVKDTFWQFNITEEELNESLSRTGKNELKEVSYAEAHNWIYGAVEFASEAGISPHRDFAVTKFILEEDDDNVELIEYEFGHNGKHCLAPRTPSETAKYKPLLDKTLGEGNYEYLLSVSLE